MTRKILPCPLCSGKYPLDENWEEKNATHTIYAGAGSSDSEEVRCVRCKLSVTERHPDKWPKETPKFWDDCPTDACMRSATNAAHKWLRKWCLRRAIDRWNKLPREAK